MLFAIPMVCREGKYPIADCYFFMINIKGINSKDKLHVEYPDVPSAISPFLHDPDLSVPDPDGMMEYRFDSKHSDMIIVAENDTYKPEEDKQPVP